MGQCDCCMYWDGYVSYDEEFDLWLCGLCWYNYWRYGYCDCGR